jgi:hypothetical protein
MAVGRTVAARLAGPLLQRMFAAAIVLVAVFMAIQVIVTGGANR